MVINQRPEPEYCPKHQQWLMSSSKSRSSQSPSSSRLWWPPLFGVSLTKTRKNKCDLSFDTHLFSLVFVKLTPIKSLSQVFQQGGTWTSTSEKRELISVGLKVSNDFQVLICGGSPIKILLLRTCHKHLSFKQKKTRKKTNEKFNKPYFTYQKTNKA
jgi:hypothetical protein